MYEFILLYIFGGIAAGFCAGLLGLGGGLIVVPFLAVVLSKAGFPKESIMHVAIATSLMIVVFTSLSSAIAHSRKGGISFSIFWWLLPGLLLGAIVGANFSNLLPSSALRIIFGTFVLIMSYNMLLDKPLVKVKQRKLPPNWKLSIAGIFISGASNMLGVGGGSLLVPFLNYYNLSMKNAVATSALCGFPVALTGVISLAYLGSGEEVDVIYGATGYLYWPAFLAMVIPSVIMAPCGVKVAHALKANILKRIFAIFLFLIGLDMFSTAIKNLFLFLEKQPAHLFFPHIDPILFQIGPISIHWYGIMYLVGIGIAWIFSWYRIHKQPWRKWNSAMLTDLVFYIALGVIIGGRLGYMLFYSWQQWLQEPLQIFRVWQGGMSFHGGLIGVIIATWIFARRHKLAFIKTIDFVVPVVPIGLFFGRIGNFINGELWGKVTEQSWGVVFPNAGLLARHPTQLYESLLEGLVLFIILWCYSYKQRPNYAVSALFLILYSVFRISIEFIREPDAHIGYIAEGWLTMGQLLSLPMLVLGVVLLIYAYRSERIVQG